MTSTFFGFNIARSGLFASQRALNITGHNISNVNTAGYTRQRLNILQSSPMTLPNGQGMLGTGVDTDSIVQIRHEFLDFKYRGGNTDLGEWQTKADALQNIEAIFNEPSDAGIRKVLDEFFSSLHELNKTPESLTVRALVRQRSIALAKNINHMAEQFTKMQSDTDFEVRTTVDQINGYSEQIKKLNRQIYEAELDGSNANDLRDQRNLIVDKLSQLTNIDYYEDNNNRFHVLINGKPLVSHFRNSSLKYEERVDKLNDVDAGKLHDIKWEDGSTFTPKGGKIKGLIDMRDNISGSDKGIPYYMERLNNFTDVLSETLNSMHKSGYDLDGNLGTNLFTINGMSTAEYENYLLTRGLDNGEAEMVAADNMEEAKEELKNKISADPSKYKYKTVKEINGGFYIVDRIPADKLTIASDLEGEDGLNKIAASATPDGVPGDGDNALKMSQMRHDVNMYEWGSPDDYVKSLISNLGVDGQEAIRMRDNQMVLLNQVETNRQSISGVSLDEEMSNMIKFQHSFNANSRMITAMDEMIDTIISRMGLVGR
ncbi:flagellar hook-associated protein FlgK [Maledivibacter halophilus]|uniref:Flagellar hook-associated protein 1 n=1 Tax=Maledivibacter halophilus TaxID=36842 RepID=A0A1T5JXC9_9FIRM|nr:flagellar hook-associated protein FlgK [Maledivibacter halophilus]SKC55909.1 flagellar hook-associated protein 1 FlgK [Maledivibacter halophilus]